MIWCYFLFIDPGLYIRPPFFPSLVIITLRYLTLFILFYFVGTMVCPCIWFGSFMRHSATSRFELPIMYAIGRLLQIWMTVFQMLHQKSSMRKFPTANVFRFLVSSELFYLIKHFYAYAEVMLPALFVVRRWPLLKNLFAGICFMCIVSVHG